MATVTIYATLAEAKARLGIPTSDTDDDTKLEAMLEGISRVIDWRCRRRFYTTESDETRYFTAEFSDRLWPGDLLSITTLKTDDDADGTYETTWTADTDYYLEPYNAALDEQPYTKISVAPLTSANYAFPTGLAKGVQIVGKWGYWTSVPGNVSEAALLLAERLFKRKDAIFGITGTADMGMLRQIVKTDPDVELLLAPVIKPAGVR
jgi:hypothetical protein